MKKYVLLIIAIVVAVLVAAARQSPSGIFLRQGGDPYNWSIEGGATYVVPSDGMLTQAGATLTDGSGQVFVYFPATFSSTPLVTFSNLGQADVKLIAFSEAGIHFAAANEDGSPASDVPINWFAVGPK